ncbi:MAG: hypothetical protein JKY31_10125 [Rhodobacteraceae bacterium]|nr:hypothetical protein [Paracoccaceae bacterium]
MENNYNSNTARFHCDVAQIFLIGWPKAGTSSLFNWLAAHPDICGSTKKETYHFIDDGYPLYKRHGKSFQDDGMEGFQAYFNSNAKIWLEGTTHTVFQDIARAYLAKNRSNSQAIAMLREPARRILSSFQATKNNFATLDHSLSFNTYVEHLLTGRMDELARYFGSRASFYNAQNQLSISDYPDWLTRWQKVLGPDKLHVKIFDDLVKSPREFMVKLSEQLKVDPEIYRSYNFEMFNKTLVIRHQTLHLLAKKLRHLIPAGALKSKLKMSYLRLQNDDKLRDDPAEGLVRLQTHFAPSVRQLEDMLKIDLSIWAHGKAK